jgi:hypothetical protein
MECHSEIKRVWKQSPGMMKHIGKCTPAILLQVVPVNDDDMCIIDNILSKYLAFAFAFNSARCISLIFENKKYLSHRISQIFYTGLRSIRINIFYLAVRRSGGG